MPANTGPYRVITDLCVLDFAPQSRRMRVRSLHPAKTLEQVQSATGFELEACDPAVLKGLSLPLQAYRVLGPAAVIPADVETSRVAVPS